MIIIRLKGGLGNQLFQYALGCSLKRRTGKNVMFDQSFFGKQNLRANELHSLGLSPEYAKGSVCAKYGAPNTIVNRIIHKVNLNGIIYPQYLSEERHFAKEPLVDEIKSDAYLDGYWQNLDYFKEDADQICREINFPISQNGEYLRYINIAGSTNSVAVHIRRGDYVQNVHTSQVHNVCGMSYYENAIKKMDALKDDPHYIFVSDDIPWCEENFKHIPSKTFVSNTSSAAEDFSIISKCKSHIVSNSTFSWWSAFCANVVSDDTIPEYVIFPKLWQRTLYTSSLNLNFMPKDRSFFLE